ADLERAQGLVEADRRALAEARDLNRRVLRLGEEGRWLETVPPAESALAIRERILGPDHPQWANSLNTPAGPDAAPAHHARPQALYGRALAIRTRTLGEQHPHTANSLNNLAYLYLRMGDAARAEPLARRAFRINRETQGPDHPDTSASLANLAAVYEEQGDL